MDKLTLGEEIGALSPIGWSSCRWGCGGPCPCSADEEPPAADVRRRHRRGRVGGVGAGQPVERRSFDAGARPRGGAARPALGRVRADAGGADVPDRQPLLRLEVRVRARAAPRWPARLPRQGQGARRLVEHQRDDLPARQPARLRALGRRSRDEPVGSRPLPAVLPADGGLPRGERRRPVPWPRRPAGARARTGVQPAVRRLLRGGPAGGSPAHRRRQRPPPGGLRRLRPQRPPRAPAERVARLPPPGDAPREPRRRHAGDGDPAGRRRRPGDGRRVHAGPVAATSG